MSARLPHLLTTLGVVPALIAGMATAGCQAPTPPGALTIAATATSHEPAPATAPFTGLLTDHAKGALEPGRGAVTVLVQGRQPVTVDLTPMRGRDVEFGPRADELIGEATGKVDQALQAGAGTDALDTLAVYDQALQVTPPGGTVVMLTSGMSTRAPVDLNAAGDWASRPDALVKAIRPADIPDATGRTVIWDGLGYADPTGHQASADTATRTALVTIWTGICQASHATRCTIIDGPAGTQAPTATNTVANVTLPMPTPACVGTTDLSADVLFQPNSPALAPSADTALAPIAATLKACPAGTRISAVGHTATVPGGGNGIDLSAARAQAVLTRLEALGVPASLLGPAVGVGDSQPLVNNMPGGHYSEQFATCNRVVELQATATTN